MKRRFIVCAISILALCNIVAYAEGNNGASRIPSATTNHSIVAIKTNLLYDAAFLPNLGVEVNVYRNWAVFADVMYADWNLPARHTSWNFYGLQYGARKYFGKKSEQRRFTGHHVGFYGQALAYDLQAGSLGQQTPSINASFGFEYGYSFRISRNINLNAEIGLGYLGGKYYEYIVEDDHDAWKGTIERSWIGPSKASLSLMWLLKPSYKKQNRK